ncbi:type II toxin-antitoxin system Phd/YefM family antitoxin [Crocosphaera sp. XPORK-15E]|uniref:type II toxin-antitoxin system Phd/YefM family antitoxin n=1 Tax=Crocosphaera sp. XPORK-15E TaxID=3110247 RepID=UPI002B1F7169|nr:type II toxin-antitoxin system Phd/YefM family antitoxin [Crocosphaera sp. XPORK-15E]MEA5534144.1 type II toxin-antitoxin system Phd/YefM family antitoxin [Crocosphaera sp. XPORK-15E]
MTHIAVNQMSGERFISITVNEAQNHLSEIIEQIETNDIPVIITHQGKGQAVMISLEAFAFLEKMIAQQEDEIDREALREARQDLEPTTSLNELKQELK